MKNFYLIIILSLILTSCSSFGDAKKVLKNEKTISTDEFLVKKKQPLVLPPDYSKMPKPSSKKNNSLKADEETIKKILQAPSKENSTRQKTSTIENSILKEIRK